MKYYHYTSEKIYDQILKQGYLSPYLFKTDGDGEKEYVVELMKRFRKTGKGIYLWKKMNNKICRDFYFYQRLINGVELGIVLEIMLPKQHNLLSRRLKYDYDEIWHGFHSFDAGVIKHRNVKFDIYLSRIPIEYISKIMEVSLKITRV